MPQFLIQSNFQFGEVSPLLHAQVTSAIYYKAAKRLRNMLVIPQGGVQKRFGLHYRATISGITDYTLIKPFIFDYEDGSRYLLIFRNLAIDIYFNDVIVATVVTTYTAAQIAALSITQTANLVFIAHGLHKPAILRRTSAHAGWALDANPTFLFYPTYDFDQNYNGEIFYVQIAGASITTSQNLLGQAVQLHSSGPLFTTNHVGGLFFGDSGTLRILSFVSNQILNAEIVQVFDPLSSLFHGSFSISGANAVLTEVAFSDARGWPQKVSFFQNRIVFARTASLLGGLWGSDYNGFKYNAFSFDDSESLDTNAISTVIYSAKKAVVIEHMVSFKTLVIMTSSGLYSTPLLQEIPVTPSNIAFINQQTADSSSPVEPVIFDNEVIFFDKGGRKVKNLTMVGNSTRYQSNNISVLAPQLVDTPYSASVFENSSREDGNWLYMTNTGSTLDGALSIYQSVPEQEITAWTLSTTDGKFRHVVCDEELVYFIVERVIDGVTTLFIEQLDFDLNMDATFTATFGSPTSVITGLSYLEGKSVRVIGDGAVMQTRTVASGQITLERAVTDVEVGLEFTPECVPMPVNVPTQFGNNVYLPKSIKSCYIDYFESAGIKINGELLPAFNFDVDHYDTPVILKTDFDNICPFNGWDPRQEISITQSDPLPFTLIGVGFVVTL